MKRNSELNTLSLANTTAKKSKVEVSLSPASTDLIDQDNVFFDFGKNSLKKSSNRDILKMREFFLSLCKSKGR